MALLKHTITKTIRSDSGSGISDSRTLSASGEVNISEVAAAGDILEIDLPVDVSQIVSFFIESDLAVVYSSGAAPGDDNEFPLTAKKALSWDTGALGTNPLTVDIAKHYFDNSLGAVDANVKAAFLVNETI